MKYFLSFFAVFLLTLSAMAQEHGFLIGAEGGYSESSLRGFYRLSQEKYAMAGNPMGGVFVQYNTTKRISFRVDVCYETKGDVSTYAGSTPNGTPSGTIRSLLNLNYVTVPLLTRYTIGQKIQYFAEAGPFVGYLCQYKETTAYNGNLIFSNTSTNDRKEDAGITSGIGIGLSLGKHLHVSVEFRDNLGLLNISTVPVLGSVEPNGTPVNNGSNKTNSFNCLLGIAYQLGT